jgi:hypothetical protein
MKTLRLKLFLPAAAVALAGCASPSACNREHETLVAMRYTGELLPYSCGYPHEARPAPPAGYSKDAGGYREGHAPAHPITEPPGYTGVTRRGAVVKAYRMGRYVDPGDPRVVHAAHTVYRVEREAGWRLAGKVRPADRSDYQAAPEPTPAATPAAPDPQQAEALKALSQRLGALEQAQRANAATQNANQQLLVGEINALKAASGKPVQAAQADPNSP